jgi:plasmid maintenance system antidote protein VapI
MRHYTEGEILKHLREKATPRQGQTQKAVAEKLGFSPQFINDVLAGKRSLTEKLIDSLGFKTVDCPYVRKPQAEQIQATEKAEA